jgi:putative salt-induced outer membrane protein
MMKKAFIVYLLLAFLFGGAVNLSAQEQKDASQWEKYLELSYVITTGNTDSSNMSAKVDIAKEGDKNRYFLKGNALYGEENDEETKNKLSLSTRWERIFSKRLFGFLSANYKEDKFSGYDYSVGGGPGLGYDIVKSEKHNLKGLISSPYYYDRFSDPPDSKARSDSYLSGKAEVDYTWQILENLTFDQTVDFLISFEDNEKENKEKFFIDSETALKVKINKNISLGVSYLIDYQNLPPSHVKKHTDTTFLTSLIIDF